MVTVRGGKVAKIMSPAANRIAAGTAKKIQYQYRSRLSPRQHTRLAYDVATFFTDCGFYVSLMIDAEFSFGQYMRNMSTNLSFGAGSQLLSLSAPGDLFCM